MLRAEFKFDGRLIYDGDTTLWMERDDMIMLNLILLRQQQQQQREKKIKGTNMNWFKGCFCDKSVSVSETQVLLHVI